MNFKNIFTIFLTLFAVIDILGSIPVIIDLQRKIGDIKPVKVSLVSGGIMIAFLFAGEGILKLVGVDLESFALAGGIVIFLVGLEMILNRNFFKEETGQVPGAIVPIAFPLVAGTGTMTTLLSLRSTYMKYEVIIAILLNLVIVYLVLISTRKIEEFLGDAGISILRKVFGVVLMAIAIKLFRAHISF